MQQANRKHQLNSILNFWKKSYHSDKKAFVLEMLSFVFTVAASLMLAVTARSPDMTMIYPLFFIGSVIAVYSYYRRGLAWPMLLTGYFAVVNVLGYCRALALI